MRQHNTCTLTGNTFRVIRTVYTSLIISSCSVLNLEPIDAVGVLHIQAVSLCKLFKLPLGRKKTEGRHREESQGLSAQTYRPLLILPVLLDQPMCLHRQVRQMGRAEEGA